MASSFSTLRQRGYGTFYAIRMEGIPYTFHEGPLPLRVDAEAVPGAGAGYTSSESFMVVDSMTIDQDLDRDAAVARGKSLSIVLSWEILEDEGILDNLFRRPEYFTTLTADVNATAAIIPAADTTVGFPSEGLIYIGREIVKYTTKTPNAFIIGEGGQRGYLSNAYVFNKDDPGSYGIITPTPHQWRGRFVTIHEHLLSPEGRILSSTLCAGDYQREIWKGYIEEPPVPGQLGMTLKALPLVRLATKPLGSEIRAKVIGMASDGYWGSTPVEVQIGAEVTLSFLMDDGDTVVVTGPAIETGADAGDWPTIPPGIHVLKTYMDALAKTVLDVFTDGGYVDIKATSSVAGNGYDDTGPSNYAVNTKSDAPMAAIVIAVDMSSGTGGHDHPWKVDFSVPSSVYWLKPITNYPPYFSFAGFYVESTPNWSYTDLYVRFELNISLSPYLSLKQVEGAGILDFALEDTGMGVIEMNEGEVIRWTDKVEEDAYGESMSPRALLLLGERMIGAQYCSIPQIPADLNEDGTFIVATGLIDDLNTAAETFLQSSGGGTRGDFDTLPLGHGMGIPEEWIDLDATGSVPATSGDVPMLTPGKQSFADLFSGWYQISNACLAMRRSSSGVLQFQIVNVVPSMVISTSGAGFLGRALGKPDVVVGGTSVPNQIVAPNQIDVDTSPGPYQSAQYSYNAIGRIQAEGVYNKTMAVPGGHSAIISAGVISIMSRGLGQSIIKFEVAPWIDAEVGDAISVTVAHPLLYDWSDGTRAPSNVPGRVLGWSKNMKTGEQTLTILLDGILASGFWLCPTTHIASISGNDVTVVRGEWFQSGETLRFYNRGKEATESADLAVTTVSGNVLTMASSPPAWFESTASGPHPTKVTHPAYASGSTDQQNPFMYVRGDKFWRI